MLSINSISFTYDKMITLNDISFSVAKGTHLAIMGESGCGKSTLLKAVYGLLNLPKGTISYNNNILLGPEHHLVPGHNFMKYLSQDFDLMPFTSASQNVGTFLSNFYPEEKDARIHELLEVVGMTEYATTHVRYLSGGQKQRIALARVLAKKPEVLLLDEPFSQIDNFKKNELRYSLFDYLKKEQITCITATHDKEDVLAFADNVVILKEGKKAQEDNPKVLYLNPKDVYTASLFSEINYVPARLFLEEISNKKIILYPHEIKISTTRGIEAIIEACYFKGNGYLLKVRIKSVSLLFNSATLFRKDQTVKLVVSKKILRERLKLVIR